MAELNDFQGSVALVVSSCDAFFDAEGLSAVDVRDAGASAPCLVWGTTTEHDQVDGATVVELPRPFFNRAFYGVFRAGGLTGRGDGELETRVRARVASAELGCDRDLARELGEDRAFFLSGF